MNTISDQTSHSIASQNDVQQMLKQHEVTAEVRDLLNVCCGDHVFRAIAKNMKCHDEVGPYLGIDEQQIEEIGRDQVTERRKKMAVLWEWRRRKGSNATYLSLVQAFLSMDDRMTAELVLKHAAEAKVQQLPDMQPQEDSSPVHPKREYPNWESLSVREREAVKQKLVVENHKVRRAYSDMFVDIVLNFETSNVNPRHIKTSLNAYIRGASAEVLSALSQVPNEVDALFLFISEHTSWLNYHLLEVVVQKLGNEESRTMLCNYEEKHLVPYLDRSVFEIPCESTPNAASQTVDFFFKIVDDIIVTGNEAIVIRDKLANLLKVPLLELDSHRVGCVELVFTLPRNLFDSCPENSPLHSFVKWSQENNEYTLNADLPTILFGGEDKTEARLLRKMLNYRQSKVEEISKERNYLEECLQQVVCQLQKNDVLIEEMETINGTESSIKVVGEKRRQSTLQEDNTVKRTKAVIDEPLLPINQLEEDFMFGEVHNSVPLLTDVTCIAQNDFTIASDDDVMLRWEECGLCMHVQQGSLPQREHCDVTIRALMYGHYQLPKASVLVSGVYAVSMTQKLLKPVLMEIQHCVTVDTNKDCDSLGFVMASPLQSSSPYVFAPVSGGVFSPGYSYGKLWQREKSFMLGVVTTSQEAENQKDMPLSSVNIQRGDKKALYPKVTCMLHVFHVQLKPDTWTLKFLVTQALNIIDTYLETKNFRLMQLYNVKQRLKKDFHFSNSQLVLCAPVINDRSSNTVLEESVHSVSRPSEIPTCEAVIDAMQVLKHSSAMMVTGAKENMDFYIY